MWIQKVRLKALAWVLAIALAAIGAISIFAIPALPAVGVAFAVVAVALNQLGHRLSQPTCYGCGSDLSGRQAGQYGVVCGKCGHINHVDPQRLAANPRARNSASRSEGDQHPGSAHDPSDDGPREA